MTLCTYCNEAELPDGQHLCTPDRVALYRILARARDVLNTAGGTLTNQAVTPMNTGGGAGSTVAGMPLNLEMLDRAHHYRALIGSWATLVAEALGQLAPLDVLNRAAWLSRQTEAIARHEWAGDMLSELRQAEHSILKAADRHQAKITLGTCDALKMDEDGAITRCPGNVTAREGDDRARCDTCTSEHSAHERQAAAISNAWHVAAPLPDLLRALKAGKYADIPRNRAEKWASLGKLQPAGTCPSTGRKHYTMAHLYEVFVSTPTGKRQVAVSQL